MIEEINIADKSIGGIVGLFIGLFIGAITMFSKLGKYDTSIKDHGNQISLIKENFMPRSEILQMHREHQSEIKELHKDVANKLDTINHTLVTIQIGLAEKADRK